MYYLYGNCYEPCSQCIPLNQMKKLWLSFVQHWSTYVLVLRTYKYGINCRFHIDWLTHFKNINGIVLERITCCNMVFLYIIIYLQPLFAETKIL